MVINYYVLAFIIAGIALLIGSFIKNSKPRKRFQYSAIALVVVGGVLFLAIPHSGVDYANGSFKTFSVSNPVTPNTPVNTLTGQTGTAGQNPSVGLSFTDAQTGQSIGAVAVNYKDASTQQLLGASPTFVQGTNVIPLIGNRTTPYIAVVQPTYNVVAGAQSIVGKLYRFQNESILLSSSTGTGSNGVLGGTLGGSGNDTSFTTQKNIKVELTGNTFRSSGRLFVIYEVSTTQNVSSVSFTPSGSNTPVAQVTVPNCYTNNLGGTPYKVAFEIPAVIGGSLIDYNLQTVSANGNRVQGGAYLTIYSEQDAVDSLNGNYLTSGICDSNNANTWLDRQINSWYFN